MGDDAAAAAVSAADTVTTMVAKVLYYPVTYEAPLRVFSVPLDEVRGRPEVDELTTDPIRFPWDGGAVNYTDATDPVTRKTRAAVRDYAI